MAVRVTGLLGGRAARGVLEGERGDGMADKKGDNAPNTDEMG